jgi:KDO2-lipid IV(A) lauroyltransferase
MFRAGVRLAGVVPAGLARELAEDIGTGVGCLPDYNGKRALVASHMSRVLGRPLSKREARHMVAAVFAYYARYWAESLRLPSLSADNVAAGVKVTGLEHIERAMEGGKGLILTPPHLGSWEWGARYLMGLGYHLTVAVEPLEMPDVFEWFSEFRRGLGMQVVVAGEPGAGAEILAALKSGSLVCLLADRLVGGTSGVDVEFFGGKAYLPAGPVALALRSGAPLMAGAIYFGKTANDHDIVFRPPLVLERTGRFRKDVQLGTQALAGEMEALVRLAPSQWHLLQPNWADDPPLRAAPWARRIAEPSAEKAGTGHQGNQGGGAL